MKVTCFATLVLVFCISTSTVAVKEYTIQERLAITHRIIKQVEAEDRKRAEQYASKSPGSFNQDFLRRRTEEDASIHFVSGGPSAEQRVASKLAEIFGGVDGGARVLVDKDSPSYFTETLAQGNTQPLKYYVSMANFDPKTARKYTTCFNVGDWYYQGPESTASGPPKTPTCPPTNGNPFDPSNGVSCWGKCEKEHVWDPKWNPTYKAMAINGAKWLENRVRVPKLKSKLRLASGGPTYSEWVESILGWTGNPAGNCGADIFYRCKTPVIDPSWCTGEGLPEGTTNIIFMTYQPVMKGGGTGGPCAFDAHGRSIAQTVNFHTSGAWAGLNHFDDAGLLELTQQYDVDDEIIDWPFYTSGFIHELLHGLGFDSGTFKARHMIQTKLPVYTLPNQQGTKDDDIVFLRKETKTSKLAKLHFDCNDDDKWQGLPLMGTIEQGGSSHHNSFVVAEAVESYNGNKITPFDMAVLEDTGFYLVDWNKVEVPNWGAYRGCDFVSTRCRTRSNKYDDAYTVVASQEECNRKFNLKSKLVQERCGSNFDCGLKDKCHPECIVLTADNFDEYMKWRPVMNGTNMTLFAATQQKLLQEQAKKEKAAKEALEKKQQERGAAQVLFVVLSIVFQLLMTMALHSLFRKCSLKHIVCCSHGMSVLLAGFGSAVIGYAIKLLAEHLLFGSLFVTPSMLGGIIVMGLIVVLSGVLQYKVAMSPSTALFYFSLLLSIVLILIQVGIAMAFMLYAQSLPALTENAAESGGRGKFTGFGMGAFAKFDNFACESYRTCCYDQTLLGSHVVNNTGQLGEKMPMNITVASINTITTTPSSEKSSYVVEESCLAAHPGTNGFELDSMDPSRPEFCRKITGADSSKKYRLGQDSCDRLDSLSSFNRTRCQRDFCESGVDGFNTFQSALVDWVYGYSMWLGMVLIVSWFFQILQLRVLGQLYTIHKANPTATNAKVKDVEIVTF